MQFFQLFLFAASSLALTEHEYVQNGCKPCDSGLTPICSSTEILIIVAKRDCFTCPQYACVPQTSVAGEVATAPVGVAGEVVSSTPAAPSTVFTTIVQPSTVLLENTVVVPVTQIVPETIISQVPTVVMNTIVSQVPVYMTTTVEQQPITSTVTSISMVTTTTDVYQSSVVLQTTSITSFYNVPFYSTVTNTQYNTVAVTATNTPVEVAGELTTTAPIQQPTVVCQEEAAIIYMKERCLREGVC